jgi:hypothetical protein
LVEAFVAVLLALSLLLAVVAFGYAVLDRLPPKAHLQGLLLLQLLVLVQAVLALVRLGDWDGPRGELLGYLAVAFLLLPGGMVLTVEERSRWGTAVLGAACLVLAVVLQRLQVVWDAGVVGG